LSTLADGHPLLAAGDFNEARAFDLDESGRRVGTWGKEYFDRAAHHHLTPWLHDQWGREYPTHKNLQLDHVLLSEQARGLLLSTPEPHLDTWWGGRESNPVGDHVPIWFALDDAWITAD
jgi:endonuclease/exonuclease/phosphatase family metal-dependent hydrolase